MSKLTDLDKPNNGEELTPQTSTIDNWFPWTFNYTMQGRVRNPEYSWVPEYHYVDYTTVQFWHTYDDLGVLWIFRDGRLFTLDMMRDYIAYGFCCRNLSECNLVLHRLLRIATDRIIPADYTED